MEITSATLQASEEQKDDKYKRKVINSLKKAGFEVKGDFPKEIMQRLVLLEKESKFNEDSRKIERGVSNVLNYLENNYKEVYPQLVFSQEQKREGRVAAILHDIGKTGPAEANDNQMEAVVKVFSLEKKGIESMSLGDCVLENFSEKAKKINENLAGCGISQEISMRDFWDKHADWTHDILEKFGTVFNENIKRIAGSHHFHKSINPYNLTVEEVPLQAEIIGLTEEYNDAIRARVLAAVDQYEASVRRSEFNHDKAMEYIRNNLKKFKIFENDKVMLLVCEAIDKLGKEGVIFNSESNKEVN